MNKEALQNKIRKALEKEGGAAGMKALERHTKATKKQIKSSVKKDKKVAQHPDKDYILAKGNIKIKISEQEIIDIIDEEITAVLDEKKKRKRKKKKKKSSGKKDACYRKVKSRYKVWPSAYASGALVKCRKVGAANWGNKSKKKK